jgi:predicted nucleotidyltransferase
MIPPLNPDGTLPPGIHLATVAEVERAFGFNPHRLRLLAGLVRAVDALQVAGCRTVYLDGSFVTGKEFPNDYDLAWDVAAVVGALLDPILLDRRGQKVKYLGDILPNVIEAASGLLFVEFFQVNKLTGAPKGIVRIDLGGKP